MPLEPSPPAAAHPPWLRTGFQWDAADAYLFDIDGTLLNCRDGVHYLAFQSAVREILGFPVGLEGLQLHGNTDPRILRAALARKGLAPRQIDAYLPLIVQRMCAEVKHNQDKLSPQLCPSILDLLSALRKQGKILGAASGNLEPIGWAKLERAGVKTEFSFGSFSWPRESRAEIFQHGVALARQYLQSPSSNESSAVHSASASSPLSAPPASVFVVGDTPADIAAARTIGVPVIAVATGIFEFTELQRCNPDVCVATAADLLTLR